MSGAPPLLVGGLVGTDNPTGDVSSIQPPRTRVALTKSAPPDTVMQCALCRCFRGACWSICRNSSMNSITGTQSRRRSYLNLGL
jgi:hypothetical protein